MNLDEVRNMEARRCPECGREIPDNWEEDFCDACSSEHDDWVGVYLCLR